MLAHHRHRVSVRFGAPLAALALALAACGSEGATAPRPSFSGNGPNGKNAAVRITLARDTLDALQATLQLAANTEVTWSSLSPGVASVDANGQVTSLGRGLGLIQALGVGGRKADTAEILVRQVPVSLKVSPDTLELRDGEQGQFDAAAADANGYPIADAVVSWLSDLLQVATVSASGLVTAVDTGTTTVRALLGELSDTATVRVLPSPYP